MVKNVVDRVLLERILADISSNINDLREEQELSWERYITEKKTRRFIERTLHITIEAMIDAAQHIIADENMREPVSYRDAFVVLAENEVVAFDSLEKYEKMASFRNFIVHYYEKIDDQIVFGLLKNNLNDFNQFITEIASWLKKINEQP